MSPLRWQRLFEHQQLEDVFEDDQLEGSCVLKHDEGQADQPDVKPESTKGKLDVFGSFVDPHALNRACCRRRIAEQNNVGVVLVEVTGLDGDVVFNLCEKLFEMDGVGDGRADGIELCFCGACRDDLLCLLLLLLCVLFFSKVMRDSDVDWLVTPVLMSLPSRSRCEKGGLLSCWKRKTCACRRLRSKMKLVMLSALDTAKTTFELLKVKVCCLNKMVAEISDCMLKIGLDKAKSKKLPHRLSVLMMLFFCQRRC